MGKARGEAFPPDLNWRQFVSIPPLWKALRGYTAKIAKCRCHLDTRRFFFSSRVIDRWNRMQQSVIDSSSVVFQEWSRAHKKDFDGLLYGLTSPLSPTAKPALEIRLQVQVQPLLVCYLVCYVETLYCSRTKSCIYPIYL